MPIDPITGQEVIEPTQPPVEVPTAEQPATPEATPSATPEAPLFDSASIEGGTYQGNIPTAIQKLTEAGITNPNEQQITDFFKLGGYYQVARDIERAIKYPDQILSADGKPGKLEAESFAERSALPTVGTAATANSYWDQNRGVQVFAPIGSYFELYPGGGVKKVKGQVPVAGLTPNSPGGDDAPNNSNFNQGYTGSNEAGNKKAVAGFKQETLGYKPIEGKTIAETGRSVFNPTTGVDEYANGDEVLIKYTDGTVERRKVGANPGESVDVNQFGRTPQELGIDRNTGIKNEDGTQKPIDRSQVGEQGGNGLAMSSDLEVIGTEYTSASGEKRKAPKGQVFMQDPKTRKILLRPESQAQYGQESTSQSILAARQKLEGSIKKHIPDADLGQLEQDFQDNPINSFNRMYEKLQQAQGVSTIKSEIEAIQKEQKTLDDAHAEEIQNINENPYYSEALRSRKVASENSKYEMKNAQLTARLQMNSTLLQNARQEAQFIASNAMEQYNADRTFDFNMLKFEAERMDAQIDAEYKLMTLAQQQKNANIKEVQGGLYDIGNKKWIIPPKADTVSPNTIAGIISDIYKEYDPAEADSVLGDVMGRIGDIGQPLSIQSIVPKGQSIGTKFGEKTFAQAHHSGVDIPATMGSPVLAPVEMKITSVGAAGGYGNAVTALGTDGITYRFAHLSGFNTKVGETVRSGQLIGKVGSTGISTGPHLHMEVIKNGKFIDPVEHFGLTSTTQPIKSKAQKATEAKELEAKKKDVADKNNELVKSDTYKTIRKAQDSLQFLKEFEDTFKKTGATSAVFSPRENATLAAKYQATILNLKEFFNLGVLNGPDQTILMGVLPDPTNRSAALTVGSLGVYKPSAATKAGIENMKKMIESTLDDRYQSLVSQYSGYSTEEIGALKDVQRIYLNQKATLNPDVKNKINQIKQQNPGLTDEEIIQIIL